eukprot:3631075-Pyramimonas_sp.AAC.1
MYRFQFPTKVPGSCRGVGAARAARCRRLPSRELGLEGGARGRRQLGTAEPSSTSRQLEQPP